MKKEITLSALSNLKQAFNTSIDHFGFFMLIYTALSEEKGPLLYFGIFLFVSLVASITKNHQALQNHAKR
ncbi:hypothetical protein QF022_000272 [Vogesella perlucida]|nr:hypothetical protein [Vogesella perlucida]